MTGWNACSLSGPFLIGGKFDEKRDAVCVGAILSPLLRFTEPVLLALFPQSMYSTADLLVMRQFGSPAARR